LQQLVAAGKPPQRRFCGQAAETRRPNAEDTDMADKTDMAILSARQRGDKTGLILALEAKVTEMVSRIRCPFSHWSKLR